jgi:hypothetical protein
MSDVICAHCAEPWDVDSLRHEGFDLIDQMKASQLRVLTTYMGAANGDAEKRKSVSMMVYTAVMSGAGCPSCGFGHQGEGEHRERQLEMIVIDGVSDDDPMLFL